MMNKRLKSLPSRKNISVKERRRLDRTTLSEVMLSKSFHQVRPIMRVSAVTSEHREATTTKTRVNRSSEWPDDDFTHSYEHA